MGFEPMECRIPPPPDEERRVMEPSRNPVSSTLPRCARSPGESGRTRVNEQEATPLADPYRNREPVHAKDLRKA